MLLQAARDFDLTLSRCIMVGDKADDIEAGKRAGCLTILVRSGQGKGSEAALAGTGTGPDYEVDDLAAAARIIATLSPPAAAGD